LAGMRVSEGAKGGGLMADGWERAGLEGGRRGGRLRRRRFSGERAGKRLGRGALLGLTGAKRYVPLPPAAQAVRAQRTHSEGRKGERGASRCLGKLALTGTHPSTNKRTSEEARTLLSPAGEGSLRTWEPGNNLEGKVHGAQPHPFQYRINPGRYGVQYNTIPATL
jgi:hypothetical protein